jgi:hypothetical protein
MGEADQNGHPGKVKEKRGSRRAKEGRGLAHLNNLKDIFQVAPALTFITSNFTDPKPPIH